MSREIVNQLTWSVSRDRLFRQCKRAYYYNYYGSWGGWDSGADSRTRKIYILKNMQSLQMWAGGVVHETAAEALRRYAAKHAEIDKNRLFADARKKLRQGWRQAVNREWLLHPKKTNLFELYYGNGADLPEDRTESVKNRVYGCLAEFADSPLLQEAVRASYLNWKPVDSLDSFLLDQEIKVWCAIDFAFFDQQGSLRIVDWKTGSEHPEELRLQLACYALYAMQEWRTPLERLRLFGVFLGEEGRSSEYQITEPQLRETTSAIKQSINDMRSMLKDPEKNQAREQDFPPCENDKICARCNFREVCPAVN